MTGLTEINEELKNFQPIKSGAKDAKRASCIDGNTDLRAFEINVPSRKMKA